MVKRGEPLLALVGFGTKAGFVPLHIWLPGAHAVAPAHISALLSGLVIELGIYGILRVLSLIGVPAYLKLDETDNLLNPTRGYRAQLSVMPAHTVSGPPLTFVSDLIAGSTYWDIGSEQRAILAGKLAVASLDGAPLAPLPADQRIYAGGGGSIRPYAYQLAGPLDIGNKPFGGRSSLVLNLEARIRITETIGVVPFVDAGSYYEAPVQQPGRTLLYGVGLGLRYYTGFGPLRVDLATPMHKRTADSPIQIYISLGQAF